MSLARLLEAQKEEVLSNWEAIVSSLAGARNLSGPALRNHMPVFYDWLIQRVVEAGRGSDFPHEQAIRHANERVAAGFDLSEVISEYAVLRDCVYEAWGNAADAEQVTPAELRILNQAIDDAIAFTAVFYARMRLFRDPGAEHHEVVTPH